MRIGYSLADSLITYPRAHNLSVCEPSAAEVVSVVDAAAGEDGPHRQSAQSADHLGHNGCFLAVFVEVVCTLSAAVHAGCGRCPLNYCVGVLPSIPQIPCKPLRCLPACHMQFPGGSPEERSENGGISTF